MAAVVGMSLLAFTPAMASVGNLGLSGPAASQPVQRVIVSGVNAAAVRANVQSLSATVGSDLDVATQRLLNRGARFVGVGGAAMEAQGLINLLPITDISVMGILPVLRRLPHLLDAIGRVADAAIA